MLAGMCLVRATQQGRDWPAESSALLTLVLTGVLQAAQVGIQPRREQALGWLRKGTELGRSWLLYSPLGALREGGRSLQRQALV